MNEDPIRTVGKPDLADGVKSLRVRTASRGRDGVILAFESRWPHDASESLVDLVREHLAAKRTALRMISARWAG